MRNPGRPGISRREFVRGAVLATAAMAAPAVLSGCGSTSVAPTLEEKIAQMLVVGFRGTSLDGSEPIARDLRDLGIGGVVLFDRDVLLKTSGRNVTSPAQLSALTDAIRRLSRTPPFISVDQEGGNVARLKPACGFPATVTAKSLGDLNDLAVTRMHATSIAATLYENGLDVNFAPVVDLNVNPDSPAIGRWGRSFSADPEVVVKHAGEFVTAHDRLGLLTALKHFPGHGSAREDSHEGFVDVTDTWSELELVPFQALIDSGQARLVMTAHIFNAHLDPVDPATLSRATLTGLLRERMGFTGVVVSDDMQMGAITTRYGYDLAVRKGIEAGLDVILVANNMVYDPDVAPHTIQLVAGWVRSGVIPEARIDASWERIRKAKAGINAPR
ncbi:MAG: glycoside hydrolase family 3 protein [Deltaproteobacteria bacterium]